MSNVKSYAAYAASTRLPVLMDGTSFVEMILQKTYVPEMFEASMRTNARYYVFDFSFENAKNRLTPQQREFVQETLDKLSGKHYKVIKAENDIPIKDEECRFVSAAMEFQKNVPHMTMQVSSARIWEQFRMAQCQVKLDTFDLDLL